MLTLPPSPQMNAPQHEGIEVIVEAIIWEKMIFLHWHIKVFRYANNISPISYKVRNMSYIPNVVNLL